MMDLEFFGAKVLRIRRYISILDKDMNLDKDMMDLEFVKIRIVKCL